MRGDIYDAKLVIAQALGSQHFQDRLADVIAEKADELQLTYPVPTDLTDRIYTYERLTKLLFPMAELLAYQSRYKPDTMVKAGTHKIGVRWSALEKNEDMATRFAEVLSHATVDVLWDEGRTFSGLLKSGETINAGPVNVLEEDFAPLLPTPQHAYLKSVTVVLEVTTWRE